MQASLQHLYVLDLNVGQQLYVVRLKYEVIILSELFVATSFLPFYCINVAHSADSTSVEQPISTVIFMIILMRTYSLCPLVLNKVFILISLSVPVIERKLYFFLAVHAAGDVLLM